MADVERAEEVKVTVLSRSGQPDGGGLWETRKRRLRIGSHLGEARASGWLSWRWPVCEAYDG